MISFEEVGYILEEIAAGLPRDIYKELNGGINLLPDAPMHPEDKREDLYILGEYRHDRNLGRYINVYYGSFIQIYGYLPLERQKEKLKEILNHEFIHHLESMAGEKDLEIIDAWELEKYKRARQ